MTPAHNNMRWPERCCPYRVSATQLTIHRSVLFICNQSCRDSGRNRVPRKRLCVKKLCGSGRSRFAFLLLNVLDIAEDDAGALLAGVVEVKCVAREEDGVAIEVLRDGRAMGGCKLVEGLGLI